MIFKNPHGYLPGGWYLKLPFSLVILLGYVLALLVFVLKCFCYRKQLSFVHYGVIAVLWMGLLEQSANYFTFLFLNYSGGLPCCPVRKDVGFTMIISAAKRATLITFLLFVSLGYGIQRPSLSRKEYTAVGVIGAIYLLAAVNYELAVIAEIDSYGAEEQSVATTTVVSSMILSILNFIVTYWIYFSVVGVVEALEKQGEIAKKEMYEKLIRSLIVWFIIGFIAESIFFGWITHKLATPWKYDMVPRFIWDSLFFLVVIQIGWLWLPSPTSKQFAYAQQLPTDDFDEFDMDKDDIYSGDEIELSKIRQKDDDRFTIEDDEDDSEDSDIR